MTDDLISRQAAIDAMATWDWQEVYLPIHFKQLLEELPSAQPEQQWIPVKTRPMTEEERRYYAESLGWDMTDDEAVTFDCKMPEDGQEIWVCSKCGNVWQDTCVVDEGIGLEENGDWLDIVAWMPFRKPKPWNGEDDE